MPGFTSLDDAFQEWTVNGKADEWEFQKTTPTTPVVGVMQSLWKGVGNPGAGSDPAATPGTVYDSDTASPVAGSMFFTDRSTDLRFLMSMEAVSTQPGTLILCDRLAGVSGISVATTGSKTVNSGALTRYSGAAATRNQVWAEVTTAFTTTAPVLNLSAYTSADGTTAQVGGSVTVPVASATLNQMFALPLTAAKAGVRSVEAGLNVGTAAAAGAVNILIVRPLARLGLLANVADRIAFHNDVFGPPQIFDNANLMLVWLAGSTTAPIIQGKISCVYG